MLPKPPGRFFVSVLYQGGRVTFPGANGGNVTVDSRDSTITFTKAAGSDDFAFTPETTFVPESSQFTQALDGSGNLVITDADTDEVTTAYDYCLLLDVNGVMVPADPQIVNRPA